MSTFHIAIFKHLGLDTFTKTMQKNSKLGGKKHFCTFSKMPKFKKK